MFRKKQPANLPSVPDVDSAPPTYDEPEIPRRPDRAPAGNFESPGSQSLAEIRISVEKLLRMREAPDAEAWNRLGEAARTLLIQMVDDVTISRNPAMKQRVVATLGQLAVKRAIPRLSELLASGAEDAITRAAAANALGRIADETVIPQLAQAVGDKEGVVRRQVGLALGRIGGPHVIGHLQKLAKDRSATVAEVATDALRKLQQDTGTNLGVKDKPKAQKPLKRKVQPENDQ